MRIKKTIRMIGALFVAFLACWLVLPLLAGTTDKTVGGTTGYPARDAGLTVTLQRTLDFSLSANTGTAAEVYQMINVPAGTYVIAVGYEMETGEDGTCTIDIGDDSDTDGYIDGANVETAQTASAVSRWTLGSTASAVATQTVIVTETIGIVTNVAFATATISNLTSQGTGTNLYSADTLAVVTGVTFLANSTAVGTNITTVTQTIYPITVAPKPYAAGKIYTSADTIDMILNNDADALKITVRALVMPVAGLD